MNTIKSLLVLVVMTGFFGITPRLPDIFLVPKWLWLSWLGAGLGSYLLARCLSVHQDARDFIMKLMVAAGVITAVYGVVQYFGYDPFFCIKIYGTEDCLNRIGGKFAVGAMIGSPNFVALSLLPVIFLTFELFMKDSIESIWQLTVIFFVLALGLLVTQSWIAISIFLFFFLYVVILSGRGHRIVMEIVCPYFYIVLVIIVLISVGLAGGLIGKERTKRLDQFTNGRVLAWHVAGEQWKKSKFIGNGVGSYARDYQETVKSLDPQRRQFFRDEARGVRWEAAHHEYLQVMAEFGIVGIVMFIVIMTLLWYHARHAPLFLFLAWASIWFEAVVHYPFRHPTTLMIGFLLTALVLSYREEHVWS